jgi:WD40 repeat protein
VWATYHASDFGVSCIAYSPSDWQTLAIGPWNTFQEERSDEVILLDMSHWKERARLKGHRRAVLSLAFSPDGKTLASGGGIFEDAGDIFLWDVADGREKARITDLDYGIKAVAFTPDGRALIGGGGIGDTRGEVRFWDPSRPTP